MEQKMEQILNNCNSMYRKVKDRYYKTVVTGDGSDSLTLKLPFAPDMIQLICTDPRLIFHNHTVYFLTADISCLGLAAGAFQYVRNGNVYGTTMTSSSVSGRVSVQADHTVTIGGMADGDTACRFTKDLQFQIVAVKLPDKTLRQRYEDFVNGLTGSGTAQVCKTKVEAAFTPEEWSNLKATKPHWTFQEV